MADVHTRSVRSFNMSRVRSRGNRSTELNLIALFRTAGVTGWRRNSVLFGRPDFVFPARRVALFVDGCFWHGCRRRCKPPPRNSDFWELKISQNRKRDRLVSKTLRDEGWTVLRIWEHDLAGNHRAVLRRIRCALALDQ